MAIAGLWETFRYQSGELLRTHCIVTIEATGTVAKIHDRMPLVLDEPDWAVWLGEVPGMPGDPAALLRASVDDVLVLRLVRRGSLARPPAPRRKPARV
jgi:putative SOS response-associated peptidase YedK